MRWSLKTALTLNFVLLASLPILLVGLAAVSQLTGSLEREIAGKNLLLARSYASELSRFLDNEVSDLEQVIRLLEDERFVAPEYADALLEMKVANHVNLEMVRVLDPAGIVTRVAPYDRNILGLDMSRQEYRVAARERSSAGWSDVFISPQTGASTLALPIPYSGGLMVGHLSLAGVRVFVDAINVQSGRNITVVDRDGTAIAHPDQALVDQRSNLGNYAHIAAGLRGQEGTYRFLADEREQIGSVAVVPETGWVVSVSQPLGDVIQPITHLRHMVYIGILLAILTAVMAALVSLHNMLSPLRQLSRDAQRIAGGDYAYEPLPTSFREITELGGSLKAMVDEVGAREASLRESEHRFRATFEQAAVGIAHISLEGRFLRVNHKCAGIMGYTREEMLARTIEETTHPDDVEAVVEQIQGLLRGGTGTCAMEKRCICKDGSPVWVNLTVSLVREEDSEPKWFVWVVEDISIRKAADDALKESAIRLQLATDASQIASWDWDLVQDRIYFSPEWKRQLGYEESEIPNRLEEWESRLHPDERETVFQAAQAYLDGTLAKYEQEFRLRHKDGSYRWIYTRGDRQLDASGSPVRVFGCHIDITERKEAEQRVRASDARFRSVIDQSPVSIQIHGLDGKLITSNEAYRKLYAFNDDVLAELYEKYNVLEDEQARQLGLMPSIEKVYAGEDVIFPPYEYDGVDTLKTLDFKHPVSRTCWVQTRGFPLKDENGNVNSAVFMSVDFTAQRRAERALETSEEKFRSLMEQAPFSLQVMNPDGRVEQVNQAFMDLWGLTEETLPVVLEKYNMLRDEEAVRRGIMPLIEQAFQGTPVVLPLVEYDAGTTMDDLGVGDVTAHKRWIQVRLYPLKNERGEVVSVVDMEEDVTERIRAEEALKESEEKFRQLIEQSPMSIQVMDPDGRITEVNQAWIDLWGYSEEGKTGVLANYNMLEDEQARERGVMPHIEKAFQGESVVLPVIEYDSPEALNTMGLKSEGPRIWMQVRLYPVKDSHGNVVSVVSMEEDITERKQAEEKIGAYQQRLRALASELTLTEEAERRRIATELHDGAAQSLAFARIQLASAIKGVAEPAATAKLDELSQLLKESLQQIRDVLLDLSPPVLNELGLSAALAEWLEDNAGRRHGLRTSFTDEAGDVPLTDDMLAVLFRNTRELLQNVVKHAQAKSVSVRLVASGDALRISVQDDGVGFDPDAVSRRANGQVSFGLFSVHERMSDLGGELEMVSVPGQGCTATLVAPLGN